MNETYNADCVAARELWAALVLAWNDCAPDLVATVMTKWKPTYGTDDAFAALAHIDGSQEGRTDG